MSPVPAPAALYATKQYATKQLVNTKTDGTMDGTKYNRDAAIQPMATQCRMRATVVRARPRFAFRFVSRFAFRFTFRFTFHVLCFVPRFVLDDNIDILVDDNIDLVIDDHTAIAGYLAIWLSGPAII